MSPLGWSRALFFGCALLAVALAARAQDPRETTVQTVAREWLALTDKLDAANSWRTAGEKFRNQMAAEPWAKALQSAREPLGAVQQRAAVSTSFRNDIPGGPDGEYALLQFRTAFEKKSEGHESVTLEQESDGNWRVIGYFIR
jgi:hypothetical protein